MSIVQWGGENEVTQEMVTSTEEGVMRLLTMDQKELSDRWKGELEYKPRAQHKIVVILRKQVCGSSVIIKIYDDRGRNSTRTNRRVHIYFESTVSFLPEELEMMNMAITEGCSVYTHPTYWKMLNKKTVGVTERHPEINV
jgi:hypothetical protein